jgi:hypothetical protein
MNGRFSVAFCKESRREAKCTGVIRIDSSLASCIIIHYRIRDFEKVGDQALAYEQTHANRTHPTEHSQPRQ